jgi:hypothetical protein
MISPSNRAWPGSRPASSRVPLLVAIPRGSCLPPERGGQGRPGVLPDRSARSHGSIDRANRADALPRLGHHGSPFMRRRHGRHLPEPGTGSRPGHGAHLNGRIRLRIPPGRDHPGKAHPPPPPAQAAGAVRLEAGRDPQEQRIMPLPRPCARPAMPAGGGRYQADDRPDGTGASSRSWKPKLPKRRRSSSAARCWQHEGPRVDPPQAMRGPLPAVAARTGCASQPDRMPPL